MNTLLTILGLYAIISVIVGALMYKFTKKDRKFSTDAKSIGFWVGVLWPLSLLIYLFVICIYWNEYRND